MINVVFKVSQPSFDPNVPHRMEDLEKTKHLIVDADNVNKHYVSNLHQYFVPVTILKKEIDYDKVLMRFSSFQTTPSIQAYDEDSFSFTDGTVTFRIPRNEIGLYQKDVAKEYFVVHLEPIVRVYNLELSKSIRNNFRDNRSIIISSNSFYEMDKSFIKNNNGGTKWNTENSEEQA